MVANASTQIEIAKRAILPRADARAGEEKFATVSFWSEGDDNITVSGLSTHGLHGFYDQEQPEVASVDQSNQQYSIYALTDAAASIVERYAYTAYGQPTILNAAGTVLAASSISNRYTYTAREWDATLGLHHFRARWMSGLTGRFLTRDPIGFAGGVNNYKNGFSVFRVDPSGMQDGFVPAVNSQGGSYPCGKFGCGGVKSGVPSSGVYDHSTWKAKRCVFILRPFNMGNSTVCGIPLNDGSVDEDVTDGSVIPQRIREKGCCEILIVGHQGAPYGHSGGATAENDPVSDPSIDVFPILPNFDLSREIRHALFDVGCKGCSLFLYTCGGGDPIKRDKNRQDIADYTGCDVYGTQEVIVLGVDDKHAGKPQCSIDSRRWGATSVSGKCTIGPTPLFKTPSKIRIGNWNPPQW